jgi:hypothetical protein
MSEQKNLTMKLPDQYYCGFNRRGDDELLGFMTPFGTDAAFDKRKYTVDSWSNSNRSKEKIEPIVFNNVLMEGFRLDRHIKRYGWNGGNVVVRVEDPRGFEVEISVANLCKILQNNTIENGLIKAKCIWGRDRAQNILLTENSQPYLDAIQNTQRQLKSVSARDIKPGFIIRLKNGKEGQYLGKAYPIRICYDFERKGHYFNYYECFNKQKHLMLIDSHFSNRYEKDLLVIVELKVAEILSSEEEWEEHKRRQIIDQLQKEKIFFPYDVQAFVFEKDQRLQFLLEEIDNQEDLGNPLKEVLIQNKSTKEYMILSSYSLPRVLNEVDSGSGLSLSVKPDKVKYSEDCIQFLGDRRAGRFSNYFEPYRDYSFAECKSSQELFSKYRFFNIYYQLKSTNDQ